MTARTVGDRVGALLGADEDTVQLLGYGVYVGEEVPGASAGGTFARLCRVQKMVNPKLQLDNGDVVWGCECWWGREESVRAHVQRLVGKGRRLVEVRIADARKAAER